MSSDTPSIVVVRDQPMNAEQLRALVGRFFGDMVKLVVDVERQIVAVGGELHADAEALLLEDGSRQTNLWGANYYPGLGSEDCIQYTALINIRPAQGNRAMEVQDPEIRRKVQSIVHRLIGKGESL